jgi:hypothetical protein
MVLPNGNDLNKLKDFIRMKYKDKKWHRDSIQGHHGFAPSAAPAVPSNTFGSSGGFDPFASPSQASNGGFDAFGSNNGGGANFDPFGDAPSSSSSANNAFSTGESARNANIAAAHHAQAAAHHQPAAAPQADRISIKLNRTNVSHFIFFSLSFSLSLSLFTMWIDSKFKSLSI